MDPEGSQVASSGDPTEDKTIRDKFVSAYDAKHQLTMEGDNKAVLVIGQRRLSVSNSARTDRRGVEV